MAKRWKREEITYLKRYAKVRLTSELAERFKVDADQVTEKLTQLGLASKDSVAEIRIEHDPLVQVYIKGTRALYGKKWRDAKKLFEKVLADTDQPELRMGAQKYLEVCERHLGKVARPDDAFLLAVYERNRGNLDEALDLCTRGGRAGKDDRFAYLASAIHAVRGDLGKAAELLQTAISMDPKNRVHACYDSDFEAMRAEDDFAELFEAAE